MKKIIPILSIFVFVSCASTELTPGGQKVQFLSERPKGCKYLGEATGNQGNFFTGAYTSNTNMETGARNDLKNKAHEMGGNAVVILTQRAAETGQSGGSKQQTNVVVTGVVLDCPKEVLDSL